MKCGKKRIPKEVQTIQETNEYLIYDCPRMYIQNRCTDNEKIISAVMVLTCFQEGTILAVLTSSIPPSECQRHLLK